MKNLKKLLALMAFFAVIGFSTNAYSQPDPEDPPGGGTGGNPGGGSVAPIGGGLEILIAMGAAYAFTRYRKNQKVEE